MDKLIFTAVSGASRNLARQQIHANNLANVNTAGFRRDLETANSQLLTAAGYASRQLVNTATSAVDTSPAALRETGRDLDIAIKGEGLIALAANDREVYTRNGQITLGPEGDLSINGYPVIGDNGPIILPPFSALHISDDGVISLVAEDGNMAAPLDVDRIKLVSIPGADLSKNEAGFLVTAAQENPRDEDIVVASRHLESANVSVMDEMLSSIALNRQFEAQIKMMKAAEELANAGNRLLRGA
ncbi:flagellar basal body rod protein FlgF [Mangrovibacter yixingensis]|uniref:flagellar basal body rod protein FlgF n=1 Tax=Mangrovibacter yixingensis TaxID=1529639 RepID=UPI001CFD9090|nr:flagellar basal body rod protein FlgF [Mangrovibacter yixingensis]